jgi:hypothetical protein
MRKLLILVAALLASPVYAETPIEDIDFDNEIEVCLAKVGVSDVKNSGEQEYLLCHKTVTNEHKRKALEPLFECISSEISRLDDGISKIDVISKAVTVSCQDKLRGKALLKRVISDPHASKEEMEKNFEGLIEELAQLSARRSRPCLEEMPPELKPSDQK